MVERIVACVLALLVAGGIAAAQTQPPASAFARLPAIESPQLSPDGSKLAHMENRPDGNFLVIRTIPDLAPSGVLNLSDVKVREIFWTSEEIVVVVFSTTEQIAQIRGAVEYAAPVAVNVATMEQRRLMQRGANSEAYFSTSDANIAGVDYDSGTLLISTIGTQDSWDLFALDPRDDSRSLVARGSIDTQRWIVNSEGEAVARLDMVQRPERPVRIQIHGLDADGFWPIRYQEEAELPELSPMGVDREGRLIVARRSPDTGRYGLYPLALDSGEMGEALVLDDTYDVAAVSIDGYTNLVVGARIDAENPMRTWFDPELAEFQRVFDASFGGATATLVSWSRDRARLIFAVSSGEAPTVYYLFDRATNNAKAIQTAYPEAYEAGVAPRLSIEYTARDGTKIPAYLTLGDDVAQPAPLVVLPHGGPEARDVGGFDWLAHFLASRGYAVLQPNFRGSDGYGKAWRDAGRGGWGTGVMQHDVSDGVDALVEAGIADAGQVCIVGASYGGYAALAGAVYTPDLYQCAVSIAGVSDLNAMIDYERDRRGPDSWALDYWRTAMAGDVEAGRGRLADMSPARSAEAAQAAVLLVHGRDDSVVPIAQSRRMEDALRDAGKDVQFVELAGEDHWMSRPETRLQLLETLDAFLAEHLGE